MNDEALYRLLGDLVKVSAKKQLAWARRGERPAILKRHARLLLRDVGRRGVELRRRNKLA